MASNESDASGGQLSLFTIDHDPLMMILDQIPIMERIRLERVCRSAGSVVAASLRRVTQLDFDEFAQIKIKIKEEEYSEYLHFPNGVIFGILRRFREHVRSVKFCEVDYEITYPYETTKEILSALIQFQPFNQLQKLYLSGFTMYTDFAVGFVEDDDADSIGVSMHGCLIRKIRKSFAESLEMLQRFLTDPSMKSLRVLDCGYDLPSFKTNFSPFTYAPCIQSVMKNCRNLVELTLQYNRHIQLEGLFPESLESIEFLTFDAADPAGSSENCFEMEKSFGMKMPSLQRIVMKRHEGKMSFGPHFAESFPSLKVLKVLDRDRDRFGPYGDLKGILETELMQLSLFGGGDSLSSALESLLIDIRASLRPCRLFETLKILHLPHFRFSKKTKIDMIRLFSNLEELSLEGSWSHETVLIDPMFRALPELTILNVKVLVNCS